MCWSAVGRVNAFSYIPPLYILQRSLTVSILVVSNMIGCQTLSECVSFACVITIITKSSSCLTELNFPLSVFLLCVIDSYRQDIFIAFFHWLQTFRSHICVDNDPLWILWWCELLGVYESGFAEHKETFAENLQDTVLCWIQRKLKWWKSSLFNEKCIYVNGCVYSDVKSLYFPFSVTFIVFVCLTVEKHSKTLL